jgi:toxin FitB
VILLDTNVVSELMQPKPASQVAHWYLMHEEEIGLTSVILGELAYGVAKLPEGRRRSRLEAQLAEWRIRFSDRIHGFGVVAAMIYGDIQAAAHKAGKAMSVPDAQIAAIALEKDAVLATRDIADFVGRGVALINPWEE